MNTAHTTFLKNLAKSALWSDPHENADYSSTYQKDLKLSQCLDMDDTTSPSKFGEVT